MKHNPKEVINIIALVDEFVNTLNNKCEKAKIQKHYIIRLKDGMWHPNTEQVKKGEKSKRCKTIMLTVADLDTKDRLTLFSLDYVFNNPADCLTAPYKRTLYRELLYNAVGVFALNMESALKSRQVNKKLSDPKTFAAHAKEPITPKDAINPKDFAILK